MKHSVLGLTTSLALFATGAVAEENRMYRDVYSDACAKAERECRWDWGKGMCVTASASQYRKIIAKNALHPPGDGGGGDNVRHCMVLGPKYSKQRASPLSDRVINVAVYEKTTGRIVATGWIGQRFGGGGN